jgi:hypothetical protein
MASVGRRTIAMTERLRNGRKNEVGTECCAVIRPNKTSGMLSPTDRHMEWLALPYVLELNDSSTLIGRQTTACDFATMTIDEFDELLVAAERSH